MLAMASVHPDCILHYACACKQRRAAFHSPVSLNRRSGSNLLRRHVLRGGATVAKQPAEEKYGDKTRPLGEGRPKWAEAVLRSVQHESIEPRRVYRRLYSLSGWSHEEVDEVQALRGLLRELKKALLERALRAESAQAIRSLPPRMCRRGDATLPDEMPNRPRQVFHQGYLEPAQRRRTIHVLRPFVRARSPTPGALLSQSTALRPAVGAKARALAAVIFVLFAVLRTLPVVSVATGALVWCLVNSHNNMRRIFCRRQGAMTSSGG